MARRLFLTLLALLGLAAQLGPAEARAGAGSASAVASQLSHRAEQAATVAAGAPLPARQPATGPGFAPLPVRAFAAPGVATVLPGIDRARE